MFKHVLSLTTPAALLNCLPFLSVNVLVLFSPFPVFALISLKQMETRFLFFLTQKKYLFELKVRTS